ncbi:hypothetical protein NEPAR06_1813 [Nematocida parisii]|uniref:Uncharacterized protein n=1 Tax=Nematocida parisii (strain ERTm3) TaxID=935791 RepID=I3EJW7_NEMP3|nr:uncharacterized protein NEPG_00957 [Nematocida parisii ERTm1]EIJ89514.1 hypothetical protein NEQG_00284 [Nematocida parisii ERTm3]KAI5145547.1 hypothetical protein NEPAR07_1766 [Nematocida parisii]EIJ94290.1 hypothetical protein NEPG_00957 [Nematocida parisii ERTm1]KAI5155420.1 hypothetical protein NEPAR06_1813 [Nematocida parisii]KAI5158088.1 hypothetical protein NEPAR05_1855 [Nematocida parisii]|eukprot:XP_013058786.1 hypothetical protein NEPG_00957 [Nematocida parisii ERTm1]
MNKQSIKIFLMMAIALVLISSAVKAEVPPSARTGAGPAKNPNAPHHGGSSDGDDDGFITHIFFASIEISDGHGKLYRFITSPFMTVTGFIFAIVLVAGGLFCILGSGGSSSIGGSA